MKLTVTGENVFAIPTTDFGVAPTQGGYTLSYSVDGVNFTDHEEATPANENLIVKNGLKNAFYKLKGNQGEAVVVY